jgi:membrane protease YdiL (CAAX protease family)
MKTAYRTAGFLPLLWIAFCCFAPVAEEMIFRGFLFEGLYRSRLGVYGAIVIPSIAWAALHLQYGFYELSQLFILGIIIGLVRTKTGSVVPGIVMHGSLNIVATIQTALFLAAAQT